MMMELVSGLVPGLKQTMAAVVRRADFFTSIVALWRSSRIASTTMFIVRSISVQRIWLFFHSPIKTQSLAVTVML